MLCDAISLAGSGMLLIFAWLQGIRPSAVVLVLGGLGALGVALHALLPSIQTSSLGDQRVGFAWISAIALGVALNHASQDQRARRIVIATLIGFMGLLALRALVEFAVDHPRTVQDFARDRERILASHGWLPTSAMAKAFERRLLQSDSSAWFGLSNVFAAYAAACATLSIGLLWSARSSLVGPIRSRLTTPGLIALAIIASIGGLALAQSKGGFMSLGVGLGGFVLLIFLSRAQHPLVKRIVRNGTMIGGVIGLLAVVGAIGMILARGAIGERIGELSILFRWFYLQGASRIFAHHPFLGVGPDGFQEAFTLAKPPECPEEVSSPHSILFDHAATLGVFGLAWAGLVLLWAWRVGAIALSQLPDASQHEGSALTLRNETRTTFTLAAVCTLAATFVQGVLVTPEGAGVRILGMLLWCAIAWGVLRAMRDWDRVGGARMGTRAWISAAALGLLAHAQIDVEASWTQSCGLVFALVGIASAPSSMGLGTREPSRARDFSLATIIVLGSLLTLMLGVGVRRALVWENALRAGAMGVSPIATLGERVRALSSQPPAGPDAARALLRDLGAVLGREVPNTSEDVRRALIELDLRVLPLGVPKLMVAHRTDPRDGRARREAARLLARASDAAMGLKQPPQARTLLDQATALFPDVSTPTPDGAQTPITLNAQDLSSLSQLHERLGSIFNDPNELRITANCLELALRSDPGNLDLCKRRFRIAQRLAEPSDIRQWAARCLALDEQTRLDRAIRGLSSVERDELMRARDEP